MGKASDTAEMVAAVRAAYHYGSESKLFDDPYAIQMLGPQYWLKCRVPFLRNHYMRQGMFKHLKSSLSVLSRARYCEDQLRQAVRQGMSQYVILGAGFDTFALRADDDFQGVTVFEVDTVHSQAEKRKKVRSFGRGMVPDHKFVAVDFEKDKVGIKLIESGFDTLKPSFFSWQGVLIYLERDAIVSSLKGLADIAMPGSVIVADFMDGRLFDPSFLQTIPEIAADLERLMAHTASKGEPILTGFVPDEFAALAETCGWTMTHTVNSRDFAAQFLEGEPDYRWPTEFDHLVTLERVQ